MTSAGLRLQWTETTGIVAKMRVRIWSYLYPPRPEKLRAGLSHQVGRAGDLRAEEEKTASKEVDTGSRLERKLGAGFLQVSLPGHRSENVFVCMRTCHPVCSASVVKSNYRCMYRKVNNSKRSERDVKKLQWCIVPAVTQQKNYYVSTQMHIGFGHVILFVCGPKQGSQRAGFPDVSYYPATPTRPSWSPNTASLTSQNQEGSSTAE